MVDFRDKMRKGLKAHQDATAAKAEINGIINDLSEAVSEETLGKVGIKFRAFAPQLTMNAKSLVELAMGGPPRETGPSQQWLIAYAKNQQRVPDEKLAQFEIAVTGYPCTLRFGGERIDAYDREGLENGLGTLLEYPETGRSISTLRREVDRANAPPPKEDS